jgi:hypothetical protein
MQSMILNDRKKFLSKEFEFILKRNNEVLDMNYKYFINKLSCGIICKSRRVLLLEKAKDYI